MKNYEQEQCMFHEHDYSQMLDIFFYKNWRYIWCFVFGRNWFRTQLTFSIHI